MSPYSKAKLPPSSNCTSGSCLCKLESLVLLARDIAARAPGNDGRWLSPSPQPVLLDCAFSAPQSQATPAARSRVWSQGGRRRYARPVYRHLPREMNARAMVSNSAYEARSERLGVTCVANFMRWRPRPLRRRNSHWIHLCIGVGAGALSSHEHQIWSRLRTVAVLLSLSCGNWMVAARRQAR